MNDCLFCSIANDDSAKLLWQNDVAAAFADLHPQAPVHVLVVPKQHVQDLDALDDPQLAGRLMMAAREVANKVGITGGYRLHINNGQSAGQVINHLHLHLLGKFRTDQLDELREAGL